MPSPFLSQPEIRELTGRQKYSAQIRALRALGIVHKVRADGSPVVWRDHVAIELGGVPGTQGEGEEQAPDWTMLDKLAG